jgi:uncharacterized repeat protein (TIGR03803 family)
VFSTLLLIAARSAPAQTETVLYNFTGGSDGAYPGPSLTPDGAGNFYGTTRYGGLGFGNVFKLSTNGSGGWNETVLYTFPSAGGPDGAFPTGSLMFDSAGNLYGTTSSGATCCGVVFELSPAGTSWTETVLYTFPLETEGASRNLIMDAAGNLYGVYYHVDVGALVFELSPSGGSWTETVIYTDSFLAGTGSAGLTMNAAGKIFGVTPTEVFELSPNGTGGWNPTVLHTFVGRPAPDGTPVLDRAGNVYGTTIAGGAHGQGVVYKLSLAKTGKWTFKSLYSFQRDPDGNLPQGGIVFDAAGNIYGTTSSGGQHNAGTIFELVAPVGKGGYTEKVLWSFNFANGLGPSGSLIPDGAGNLYGTTVGGGTSNWGVVFELTP